MPCDGGCGPFLRVKRTVIGVAQALRGRTCCARDHAGLNATLRHTATAMQPPSAKCTFNVPYGFNQAMMSLLLSLAPAASRTAGIASNSHQPLAPDLYVQPCVGSAA